LTLKFQDARLNLEKQDIRTRGFGQELECSDFTPVELHQIIQWRPVMTGHVPDGDCIRNECRDKHEDTGSAPASHRIPQCISAKCDSSVLRHEEARQPDPNQTAIADSRWRAGPSRFSPSRNRPRNVLSRKKLNIPSIARVWPITPAVLLENMAQFVPN